MRHELTRLVAEAGPSGMGAMVGDEGASDPGPMRAQRPRLLERPSLGAESEHGRRKHVRSEIRLGSGAHYRLGTVPSALYTRCRATLGKTTHFAVV